MSELYTNVGKIFFGFWDISDKGIRNCQIKQEKFGIIWVKDTNHHVQKAVSQKRFLRFTTYTFEFGDVVCNNKEYVAKINKIFRLFTFYDQS